MKRAATLSSFCLTLLLPLLAAAQPSQPLAGPDGWRPPGTRTRTAAEEKRFGTGPDELQPRIGRPGGFQELTLGQAEALLRELRAELPEARSVESLKPGLEDYRAVNGRIDAAVARSGGGLTSEVIGRVHGLEVKAVHVSGGSSNLGPDGKPKPRILLLGGVHSGTEKAGFESVTRTVERLAGDPAMRAMFDITVIPLVNPTALVLGTRENAKGVDINRTFTPEKLTPESRVLYEWAQRQRSRGKLFDVLLDMHTAGDPGRNGFFLIRGQADGGLGARMMQALPKAALLDAKGAPGEARVGPYMLYGVGLTEIESIRHTTMDLLARQGTPYVYVFEAPTRASPKVQVDLSVRFIESALNNARVHGKFTRAPRERVRERAAEVDPARLEPFRRADGTLDMKRLVRSKVLPEVGGLAHFGLALFLKELAVVTATGDRTRIEEFFDGLMTTDFYKHYGLFVAGARAGELAYAKALQRYVKPRFVNGLLKTNVVLATGIALPMIVDGTFEGRAFAVTLGSLGLSSAAVKSGVAGIKWVAELSRAKPTGLLARVGLGARAAKVGGWVYTAAELAVVLYLAEELQQAVDQRLALSDARDEVTRAGAALIAAANDPAATPERLAAAAADYGAVWSGYRNFLYQPLQQDEALLNQRLGKLSRRAQLLEDERRAALERLERFPALKANVVRRHGSVEAYAAARAKTDQAELQADLEQVLASYERERETHLREIYRERAREGQLLAGVEDLDWHLRGAPSGAAGDPYRGRVDVFARVGRDFARGQLERALGQASRNRLQAYADERALLSALSESLRGRGQPELAASLDAASVRVERLERADRQLIERGLVQELEQSTR